jgi:hypothetical protein
LKKLDQGISFFLKLIPILKKYYTHFDKRRVLLLKSSEKLENLQSSSGWLLTVSIRKCSVIQSYFSSITQRAKFATFKSSQIADLAEPDMSYTA